MSLEPQAGSLHGPLLLRLQRFIHRIKIDQMDTGMRNDPHWTFPPDPDALKATPLHFLQLLNREPFVGTIDLDGDIVGFPKAGTLAANEVDVAIPAQDQSRRIFRQAPVAKFAASGPDAGI